MTHSHWIDCKRILIAIVSTGAIIMAATLSPPMTASKSGTTTSGLLPAADTLDTKKIDQVIGRSGEMRDGVYKIGLPRTDLKVTADGVDIKPGFALGSWMAFERVGNHSMVMGDLVLLESEINPTLSRLEEGGIEISAIHNHVLNEQPRIMYMHFMGHGDEERLAGALKEALSLTGTPMGAAPAPSAQPAPTPAWKEVQDIIGVQGRERGGVLQIGVARYPVGRCQGNHGMALDPERHRAFLQCEGNNLMTVFDLDAHKPIAYMPTAAGGDVVKFDSGLRRIYVACYSGAISVFQEEDADHFRKLEDFPVQKRVHSLAVDVKTHRVYAPEEQEDGRPVSRMIVYDAVVKRP